MDQYAYGGYPYPAQGEMYEGWYEYDAYGRPYPAVSPHPRSSMPLRTSAVYGRAHPAGAAGQTLVTEEDVEEERVVTSQPAPEQQQRHVRREVEVEVEEEEEEEMMEEEETVQGAAGLRDSRPTQLSQQDAQAGPRQRELDDAWDPFVGSTY